MGVDRFDWEIITYMVSWAPYAGPREDDALPAFGMTNSQLQERFTAIVTELHNRPLRLNREQYELLWSAMELVSEQSSERTKDPTLLAAPQGRWVARRGTRRWESLPGRRS